MSNITTVHGHEIIHCVATHPEGIAIDQLQRWSDEQYGAGVTYYTCSAEGMNLAALLEFLEVRDKVRVENGVVFPGGAPACDH